MKFNHMFITWLDSFYWCYSLLTLFGELSQRTVTVACPGLTTHMNVNKSGTALECVRLYGIQRPKNTSFFHIIISYDFIRKKYTKILIKLIYIHIIFFESLHWNTQHTLVISIKLFVGNIVRELPVGAIYVYMSLKLQSLVICPLALSPAVFSLIVWDFYLRLTFFFLRFAIMATAGKVYSIISLFLSLFLH